MLRIQPNRQLNIGKYQMRSPRWDAFPKVELVEAKWRKDRLNGAGRHYHCKPVGLQKFELVEIKLAKDYGRNW